MDKAPILRERPHCSYRRQIAIRTTPVVMLGLCAAMLMMCGEAGAQDCPPAIKTLFPQQGKVKSCSYSSASPVMMIEASIEIPRPDLPDHPFGFDLKVLRKNVPELARRTELMAQEEIARIDKAKAAELEPAGFSPVRPGPLQAKSIPGGKAWYRKIVVGAIGENTSNKVYYDCEYYVLDGLTVTALRTTASSTAEADGWLQKIRTGLIAIQ